MLAFPRLIPSSSVISSRPSGSRVASSRAWILAMDRLIPHMTPMEPQDSTNSERVAASMIPSGWFEIF